MTARSSVWQDLALQFCAAKQHSNSTQYFMQSVPRPSTQGVQQTPIMLVALSKVAGGLGL